MNTNAVRSTRWVTRAVLLAFAALVGTAIVIPDAEAARRMGGAKSFGRQAAPPAQRDAMKPPAQQPAQAAPAQPAPAGAAAPAAGNRWLGPLTGIAAGLGIAALLSHLGLSAAFAEFLASALVIGLLVLAGLFIWRMLRGANGARRPLERRIEPAYGGAAAPAPQTRPTAPAYVPHAGSQARPGSVAASMGGAGVTEIVQAMPGAVHVPADFDVPAFLRNAKVHFYRLQASWDRRDLADLSEFTTPEVFAELRTQLTEDPERNARNEVMALEADLLGVDEGPVDWLASVRFRGEMREEGAAAAEAFEEIWNLAKRKDGRTGWLLAGIQQVH
jgi:predicted lipid-binding transport protein (Tim44 family)